MLESIKACDRCGSLYHIYAEDEVSMKRKIQKSKYCEDCKVIKRKEAAKEQRKKRRTKLTPDDNPVMINKREFDKGYERFWAKRGMEPPKVDPWGVTIY